MSILTKFFGSEEEKEKEELFNNGRKLYYHSPAAGVAQMEKNATTQQQFKDTASKQWEIVKDKLGRDAAFNDSKYQELMGKAYEKTT